MKHPGQEKRAEAVAMLRQVLQQSDEKDVLEIYRAYRARHGTPLHCENLERSLEEIIRLREERR